MMPGDSTSKPGPSAYTPILVRIITDMTLSSHTVVVYIEKISDYLLIR